MRIHRLIAILVLIEKKGIVKAKDLASNLEVSTRTIYRDIDILCEAGFPLYSSTGPEGGIMLSENFSIGASSVNEDQILPLILQTLPQLPLHNNLATTIKNGFDTISKNIFNSDNPDSNFSEKILVDSNSWWGEQIEPFNIKILVDALWQLQSVKINYRKINGEESIRLVNPYGLILKSNTWYLIAYCLKAKAIRTFHCSRIKKSQLTNNHYQIPSSFKLNSYWNKSSQKFKRDRSAEEIYPVKIKLPVQLGSILSEYEVSFLKEENNYYTAEINLYSLKLAKDKVLPLLSVCEIISPNEIRGYARRVLKNIIELYN